MANYDRRTAAGPSKSIDALKPLVADAEEAAAAYKRGLAEIEKARSLVVKVFQGAHAALPPNYDYPERGRLFGPREGDEAHAVLDYARHLRDELTNNQLDTLKKYAPEFDEFVSELKDNIRIGEQAASRRVPEK